MNSSTVNEGLWPDCTTPIRSCPAGSTWQDDQVRITSDFECGNGCNIDRHPTEANCYTIDVEPEPGEHRFKGMAYYFCFRVTRLDRALKSLRVWMKGNASGAFSNDQKHVVLRHQGQWAELGPDRVRAVEDLTDVLEIDLDFDDGPDETYYVSNYHWHPYSELISYLKGLDHADATVSLLGASAQRRPLYRVDIGPTDAPTLVMAATPQASEMGAWTCRTIIDWLLSDSPDAIAVRRRHRFVIVPMTNPDGAVQGLGVSHPLGRFPYFEGERTAKNDDPLPEMKAVWQLLCDERPWLFIEWHSNNWDRRPGHTLLRFRPELSDDPRTRRRWEAFDRRLLQLPDTHHGNWTSHDEGMYQESLCFQAITRLGCISHMIKHHDKYPIRQTARHAVHCVIAAVDAFEEASPGRS